MSCNVSSAELRRPPEAFPNRHPRPVCLTVSHCVATAPGGDRSQLDSPSRLELQERNGLESHAASLLAPYGRQPSIFRRGKKR